ncbi:hypothetical protein AAHC03_05471 [Spirometra sp. Aus1]
MFPHGGFTWKSAFETKSNMDCLVRLWAGMLAGMEGQYGLTALFSLLPSLIIVHFSIIFSRQNPIFASFKAPDSDKQAEGQGKFNVIRKCSSFEGLRSLALFQPVNIISSRPTATDKTGMYSEDSVLKVENALRPSCNDPNVVPSTSNSTAVNTASVEVCAGKVYRCDSQGTIYSTDSYLAKGRGRSAYESTRHLSDSSGYEAFPWDTESQSSIHSPSDPDTASEPELPSSRAIRAPAAHARNRITPRMRPMHCRGRRSCRRHRRRRQPHRNRQLPIEQPMVDLKNMVMVPFDSSQWAQSSEDRAAMSEHQPQESVAVQTSPVDVDGAASNEADVTGAGRRHSAIKLRDVVAPIFRKNSRKDTVQTPADTHEVRRDLEKKKAQHPSEGVLKKLLRFVKPCARSTVEYTPPATRIVSGRTHECGPVVFTAARTTAIPILSSQIKSVLEPDHSPSLSPSTTIPSQTSSISSPAALRHQIGMMSNSPVDSRNSSGTPSSRKTKSRVRILGERPQPLVHRVWQDSDVSGSTKPTDHNTPISPSPVNLLTNEPPGPSQLPRLPFAQETLGRRPQSPAATSVTDKLIALPTAPTLSRPPPSSLTKDKHNYAELSFNNLQAVEQRGSVSATGTCDSSSLLAHIPPPMPLLNPLNFSKLRSVLSCESESRESAPSGTQILHNNFTINQLYDMDLSSCSTAYESIVDLASKTGETADTTKPKPDRKVYEDAEALYLYLSHIKTRSETTESAPTSADQELDAEKGKDCVAPKPSSASSPSKE